MLAKTGFSYAFESDREHLIIPLTVDPEPFFLTEGPEELYLFRKPKITSPPLLFKIENFLSIKTLADGPFDFRLALTPDFRYTFTLKKNELVIGRIPKQGREQYSKHLVLAKHQTVIMAGEMWVDADGTLCIANASGSYKPTPQRLKSLVHFIESQFKILKINTYRVHEDGSYQRTP
ncbi:MAG: hypothetical protein K2X47_01325 [Bdellovibrionales bacterium]|nr:hypothetical protein [Bdellovibrionales bacterium]